MTTATLVASKTYTAAALDAELGRRRNNKGRDTKVRAKGFVLPSLSAADMVAIKAGEVITKTFKSGRVETVGLKA